MILPWLFTVKCLPMVSTISNLGMTTTLMSKTSLELSAEKEIDRTFLTPRSILNFTGHLKGSSKQPRSGNNR